MTIHLRTGANGACKTLMTLREVRDRQLQEPHRQVFFHGFEALPTLTEEFGWRPFDPRLWQDLPDGSICIMDECQNEFGTDHGKEIPEYVQAIAQFRRKRGFDFWMITPHPMMLHTFVRRCIENPSEHWHYKRVFGSEFARVGKFNYVNTQCDKPGSFAGGQVATVAFPKQVYGWYRSAEVHTVRRQIPLAVYVVAVCAVVVPIAGYVAFKNIVGKPDELRNTMGPLAAASSPATASGSRPVSPVPRGPITAADYIQARTPRVPAFAFTAPAYDGVTQPTQAPYPAACVVGRMPGYDEGEECRCWTQQATRLEVPDGVCRQIARSGFFVDWMPVARADTQQRSAPAPVDPPDRQQVWVIGETPRSPEVESKPREPLPLPGPVVVHKRSPK